jgi:hypothetical protein
MVERSRHKGRIVVLDSVLKRRHKGRIVILKRHPWLTMFLWCRERDRRSFKAFAPENASLLQFDPLNAVMFPCCYVFLRIKRLFEGTRRRTVRSGRALTHCAAW